MRKVIVLLLLLLTLGVACSPSNNLPEIPITDNMKIEESETQEFDEDNTLSTVYVVEGADQETFLKDYQQTLNDAGWATVERSGPGFLTVEKEGYEIFVIALQNDDNVNVNTILRPKDEQ